MIQHMPRIADTWKPKHAILYEFMLIELFDKLNITFHDLKFGNQKNTVYSHTQKWLWWDKG